MLGFYPTDVQFLKQMGLLKVAQKQRGDARRIFNDIILLDPENFTAKEQLMKLNSTASR